MCDYKEVKDLQNDVARLRSANLFANNVLQKHFPDLDEETEEANAIRGLIAANFYTERNRLEEKLDLLSNVLYNLLTHLDNKNAATWNTVLESVRNYKERFAKL
jgi:hypothetical protein